MRLLVPFQIFRGVIRCTTIYPISWIIAFFVVSMCCETRASGYSKAASAFEKTMEKALAATLGDRVWNDADQNGLQNAGEAGISGVTVVLEVFSGPALPTPADLADPAYWSTSASTTTNVMGSYSFTIQVPGYYRVKFGLLAGNQFTQPNQGLQFNDSNANIDGYSEPVLMADGLVNNTVDAGMFQSLPVRLAAFDVTCGEEHSALLQWMTTEESNSSYFAVERSDDARAWREIARVEAKGDYHGVSNYQYADTRPVAAIQYYRLKMVDADQTYTYSSIRSLDMRDHNLTVTICAYPNPATSMLFVDGPQSADLRTISILDINGRTVLSVGAAQAKSGINIHPLRNGTYIVSMLLKSGASLRRQFVVER